MDSQYFHHSYYKPYLKSLLVLCLSMCTACGDSSSDSGNSEVLQINSDNGAETSLSALPFNASEMSTMLYECVDADEDVYSLQFFAQGTATLTNNESEISTSGSYSLSVQTLNLNFPEIGLNENSNDQQVKLGILGQFLTPSLYCFAVAFNAMTQDVTQFTCPSSNHIPNVSFENDEFYLRANGNVFWRHWDNLVEANDRIYAAQNGIWRQQGNQIAMFFGSPFFEPRLMTGTINNGALLIDQLDTSNGPCE